MSTVAEMVQYIVNLGFYSISESAALAGIHVAAESTSFLKRFLSTTSETHCLVKSTK